MKYLDNLDDFQEQERLIEEFSSVELITEKKLNFKLFNKVYDYFNRKIGKRVWLYTALFLQKLGLFKKHGVKIYSFSTKGVPKVPNDIKYPKKLVNEERVPQEWPNDNVPNLDAEQLKDELLVQFITKEPIFIWGAPGIGKSDIVEQVAKKLGIELIIFTLSLRDPVDFLGLPSIKGDKTIYNAPGIFPPSYDTPEGKEEAKSKGGILFFDEMNQGHPTVLKAAMRLMLQRKLDNYTLPPNWTIFAAGNREGEAEVEDLAGPITNRMSHVNYVADVDSWIDWARSEEGKKAGEFLLDPNILAFVKFNNKYFHYLDPEAGAPAWASPRSWTKASEEYLLRMKMAAKRGKKLTNDEIINMIGKRVGKPTAIEFVSFLDLIKTVDIEKLKDVFNNPKKAPLPPKRGGDYIPDKTYAMLSAIVYSKEGVNLTAKEFGNVVDYAIRLEQEEFATSLITLVSSMNKHLGNDPAIHDIIKRWSDHYDTFLGIGEDEE